MATQDNDSVVSMGTATADWGTITYVTLHDGSTYWASDQLSTSVTVNNGDAVQFDAAALEITVTSSEFTTAAENAAIDGITANTLTVKLHTGNPGTQGTANVVTAGGYADGSIPSSDWS